MPVPKRHPAPRCPRCGYDLSGQVATWTDACPFEGVCTECGLTIAWSTVLGDAAGPPRWSIEHAPARRIPVATLETAMRALRPNRLYQRLQLHHDVRPWRLAVFVVLLFVPAWLAWSALLVAIDSLRIWISRGGPAVAPTLESVRNAVASPLVDLQLWRSGIEPGFWLRDPVLAGGLGMLAGLTLVTVVVRSARRPRVRAVHTIRIASLALAPLGLYAVLPPLDHARARLDAWAHYRRPPGAPEAGWFALLTHDAGVVSWISGGGRLLTLALFCAWAMVFWAVAMRVGLRLERSGPVLFAASVTGLLLALVAAVYADPFALQLLAGM